MTGRSIRRLAWAAVIVAVVAVLAYGVGPAFAQAPNAERAPTELWQQYPLDPLSERQAARQQLVRIPSLEEPSSPNWVLRIGAILLVAFLICDASFLLLSRYVVRRRARTSYRYR